MNGDSARVRGWTMIPTHVIHRLLEEGLREGAHYIDVRIMRKDVFSASFEDALLAEKERSEERGASIRVFTRRGVGRCSTSHLSEEHLREAIVHAVRLAELSTQDIPPFTVGSQTEQADWTRGTHQGNPEDVVHTLAELAKSGEPEESETKNVLSCVMSETYQTFLNSEGSFIETVVPRTFFTATAHKFIEGKLNFLIQESFGATSMMEEVEHELPPLVERLYHRVKAARSAKSALPQKSPSDVVLDCSAAGMVLHEAVGHALEADAIVEGTSPFTSDMGREVAPDVTIVDDATIEGAFGSYPYDADGFCSERKVLIDHGVLSSYLVDLECGLTLGMNPNGSGRVAGFSAFPLPRSSNVFIEGGDWDNDEILEESRHCIFIKTPSAALISPDKTSFYIESYDAYLLDNGSDALIKNGIKMFFDTRDILNKITALGNAGTFFPTVCMKERQIVPVSVCAPRMKLTAVHHLCSG